MTDIFEDKVETPTNQNNAAPIAEELVNKLMEITDETGRPKYTDPIKALEALKHAQGHIPTLERENATLRQKAEEVEALKAQIEQFRAKNVNEEKPQAQTQPQGGLSEEAVAELVKKVLSNEGSKALQQQNIAAVDKALTDKFGDKAGDIVAAKAAELGITKADLKDLSATKPKVALELLGIGSANPSPTNPTSSTVRPPNAPPINDVPPPAQSLLSGPGATGKKRAEYMAEIRKNVHARLGVTT